MIFFQEKFDSLENADSSHFVGKCKDYSIATLKLTLKTLKKSKSGLAYVTYAARTICIRLRNNNMNSSEASIH